MMKTARILMCVGLMTAAGSEARAQPLTPPPPATRGFLNVNGGSQPPSRFVEVSQTFPVYGENATLATSQTIGSGALFDISAGYQVVSDLDLGGLATRLAVGVGLSNFSNSSGSAGVVVIPDPLIFGQPRTVTVNLDDLRHSERAVYLQAVWFFPIADKIDVSLSVGPTFIRVKQEFVGSVTIPPGTQTATPVVTSESKTATGALVGFDGTYMVTKNFGAGAFVRYAGATVDLPSIPGLHVGGLQYGVGARIRF